MKTNVYFLWCFRMKERSKENHRCTVFFCKSGNRYHSFCDLLVPAGTEALKLALLPRFTTKNPLMR
ncbi:MAG: hypothetical protein R6V52_00025 [Bacteroidales bacterium]